jgi:hypothetical protein
VYGTLSRSPCAPEAKGRLRDVQGEKPKRRQFKQYPIGFFHIDIAQVTTAQGKRSLFVAIDRTSKLAFARLYPRATRMHAAAFLKALIAHVPYRIHTILTDNGVQFAPRPDQDRYIIPLFERICRAHSIENLLDEAVAFLQPIVDDPNPDAMDKFKRFMEQKSKFQTDKREYAALLGKLMQSDTFQQKYVVAMAQRMVPLFAKIIQQGTAEGVFHVEYPYETADILIRAIVGVPTSYAYDAYKSDDEKRRRYLLSLRGVIGGTLGIENSAFSVFDE